MRQFDPWPVFFKREWRRNWPFLVGFAITGSIITKISLGLTEEQAKNSAFVQRHNKRVMNIDMYNDGLTFVANVDVLGYTVGFSYKGYGTKRTLHTPKRLTKMKVA
ncbi:hypothetical protein GIB67_010592 [Kingdonia uniflora]|uniref:Uncharacterized protein n=1 Tax=Kingdonia uniflora TaxID=39325 RepID=A0A7J7MB90_9MAGN|nr:hypothetical protein GIB67_010592 [Kingdonia uniflora]